MSVLEFNEFVVRNSDPLKMFALSLTKDTESAKDLMQETLYKAMSNREKYHAGTNIKAWMYTIMRNIFINNYRRRARYHGIFDTQISEYLVDQSQAGIPGTAEMNLRLKEIRTAVHKLPKIFRYPFELHFEGYRYHEIARLLDEPLGTIKSRIHFARKLLKEQVTGF